MQATVRGPAGAGAGTTGFAFTGAADAAGIQLSPLPPNRGDLVDGVITGTPTNPARRRTTRGSRRTRDRDERRHHHRHVRRRGDVTSDVITVDERGADGRDAARIPVHAVRADATTAYLHGVDQRQPEQRPLADGGDLHRDRAASSVTKRVALVADPTLLPVNSTTRAAATPSHPCRANVTTASDGRLDRSRRRERRRPRSGSASTAARRRRPARLSASAAVRTSS